MSSPSSISQKSPTDGKPTLFSLEEIEKINFKIGSKLYFTSGKRLSYQIPGAKKAMKLGGQFSLDIFGIKNEKQAWMGNLLKDRIFDGDNQLDLEKKIFTIQQEEASSTNGSSPRGGKRKRNKSRKVRKRKSRRNISKKYFFW